VDNERIGDDRRGARDEFSFMILRTVSKTFLGGGLLQIYDGLEDNFLLEGFLNTRGEICVVDV